MGDLNQYDFIINNKDILKEPVLEIGSKNYGNVGNYRKLFNKDSYIGIDQEKGEGVDIVCDFSQDYNMLKDIIKTKAFKTVICFSMLEHCKNPFLIADNITKFLKSGGKLLISVPFVWNIHSFPDDYWRFTPSALKLLFNDFILKEKRSFYSTKIRGETFPLTKNISDIERFKQNYIVKLLIKLKILQPKYPYVLFPVMVNGFFIKK